MLACSLLGASAAASCFFDTPELHLEQPWCSKFAPDAGHCWDFDRDAAVDEGWTGLRTPDLTFARVGPPAHSPPNAFQARIEPPRVSATTLRQTEPLANVAKFAFAMRVDPGACVRAATDGPPLPYPLNTLVAYAALGTGTSGALSIPVLFMLSLKDGDTLVAGYTSRAEDAGDVLVDERHRFTNRPRTGLWMNVKFEVIQTEKRTAAALITVDDEQAAFRDVPLTGSEATVTVGLGLGANTDGDGGYAIKTCSASFDNVTLDLR